MDEFIPIDEVILVKEANLVVPYHDIKTVYDFIRFFPDDIPHDLLNRWHDFLVENY